MKTDLEILIEHLQTEVEYLKSSMDDCVADWDFDGAKAFREPLIYTRSKLNVLRCLENPNYNKISQLSRMISNMEKSLNERKFEMDCIDEQTRQRMEEHFNESTRIRIEKLKNELKDLQAIDPKQQADNDKIFELLEKLDRNEISEIAFEIIKTKIFLILRVNNNKGMLTFKTTENIKIEDYLVKPTISILHKLGFDKVTLQRQIPNFYELDKIKILEEMAIIYFEVFSIFGEDLNIKVE